MNALKVNHLKEIVDPFSRYLFLLENQIPHAFLLCGVEKNSFVITDPRQPSMGRSFKGYFVASHGRGVVHFQGSEDPIDASLCRILVQLDSMQIENRRAFYRQRLNKPRFITFEFQNKTIEALLVDMSEGGFRLSLDERLPTQMMVQFELKFPQSDPMFVFKTDGLVVYCEPEETPDSFVAGIHFVAPHFANDQERKTYEQSRKELKTVIQPRFRNCGI